MEDTSVRTEEVPGKSGEGPVSPEELSELKELVDEVRTDISTYLAQQRTQLEDVRFARWAGQNTAGRKREADLGSKPYPFENASDNRCRTADKIINERVMEKVIALERATPKARGVEGTDEAGAGKIETLVRWLIKNQWSHEFGRQGELAAQFQEGDNPALAVLMVDWFEEQGVEYRELSADELAALLLQDREPGPDMEAASFEVRDLLTNPLRERELAEMLAAMIDDLPAAASLRMAKELQAAGVTRYAATYTRCAHPKLMALRAYEDVFYPPTTRDPQRARVFFLREWLTRAEVEARAVREGWSDQFVLELIGDFSSHGRGREGESAFTEELHSEVQGQWPRSDHHRGEYEVITSFQRAVNEDGVLGIWLRTFSYFCETPATGRVLFDRKHGKYPFVFLPRESLTQRINDSRSVSELASTDQQSEKLLKDSFEDHTQVNTNPPVKRPPGRAFSTITLQPFGVIEATPRDDVQYMSPPPYPNAADKYWREIRRGVNEYFGRHDPEIPEAITLLHSQFRVNRYLSGFSEALMMAVQLMQQFMSDAQLQRIMGGNGMPVARSVEEIQGRYDVTLSFDVRDLNMEYLKTKAELALKYARPLDTRNRTQWDLISNRILQSVDANWAEESILPAEVADEREVRDEQAAFVSALNGVEAPMPAGNINAPLRLQEFQRLVDERMANPSAYAPITPMASAILQNRLKYLQFQVGQLENADIGRVGTEPVAAEEAGV